MFELIDLRKEVNYLLDNYGIDVLYVRNSKYMRCTCYNELYKTGNSNCNICLGSGKIVTIEKITSFCHNDKYYSKLSGAGRYNVKIGNYVFKHDANIVFNDLIIIVGYKGDKIVDVKKVYKVNDSNAIRGDKGRIEYYEVEVLSDNTLVNKFDRYFKHNNKIGKKRKIGKW